MRCSPLEVAAGVAADLAELQVLLGRLAAADMSLLTGEESLDTAGSVETARRLLDAASLNALAQVVRSGAAEETLGMRPAQWLAHTAQLPARVARRRIALARTASPCGHEPLDNTGPDTSPDTSPDGDGDDVDADSGTDSADGDGDGGGETGVPVFGWGAPALAGAGAALARGRVGVDHLDHIERITNPRNKELITQALGDIVDAVAGASFERWAREISRLAEELDVDGAHDPDSDEPVSKLNMSRTGDLLRLTGDLFGPLGRLVESAIAQATNELFDETRNNPDLATRVDGDGTQHRLPASALRAEALGRLCERGLGIDLHSSRGPRDSVTLVLNPAEPDMVTDHTGNIVEHQRYGAVLCDPTFHPLVMSIDGVPLDAGRDARYATRQQRRAAALRDGGCVFPGCAMPPSWADLHHVEQWHTEGGNTDIANLVCLCRFHHGVIHRNGWTMTTRTDGWPQITTPNGTVLHTQRHGRSHTPPDP